MEATPGTNVTGNNIALCILGAAAGGVAGYFTCAWLLGQGLYGLALPGTLLGLGCGIFVKSRSMALAIACGIAGLLLGFFCEWRLAPFTADSSLGYFLSHLSDLRPRTFVMVVLGGIFAFWFALGRSKRGLSSTG